MSESLDILGPTTSFEGNVEIKGDLRVDGGLKGEVRCRRLVVAKTGSFEGKARVGEILIEGWFSGDLVAEGLVSIRRTARVRATVLYKSLSVEEGALFDGQMESFEGREREKSGTYDE